MNSTWLKTIGRVAFMNCDPLFFNLSAEWNILAAPPAWLTGHVLNKDCILAPIPTADYAKYRDELVVIPDIVIGSKGEVGSVLLFGHVPIEEMKRIAVPTDSATSIALLKYLISRVNTDIDYIPTGPDFDSMMSIADGALLIGDRALEAAKFHPDKKLLDLGEAWYELTHTSMIFGVFVARKDTPVEYIFKAKKALYENLMKFEHSTDQREAVVEFASQRSGISKERLNTYFGEVFNRFSPHHTEGLNRFLCDVFQQSEAEFAWKGEEYGNFSMMKSVEI